MDTKLEQFIREFLWPSKSYKISENNRIDKITDVINRIFLKYYNTDTRVDDKNILETLIKLHYQCLEDKDQIFIDNKRPASKVFYANIDTEQLKLLRLTLMKLPDNTAEEKREKVRQLIMKLQSFKK